MPTDFMLSRTPWFYGVDRPVRVGWYERYHAGRVFKDWWSGYAWLEEPQGRRCDSQWFAWRGLTYKWR